ncbi:hypothetical protein [Variovorax sp. 3319]|uniref:hypothetical protein n=1 Tax=Variovorax TaxID=34072 RepID=UPI0038F7ED5E
MPATTAVERPILFSAHMVRALLDGSKTQTRRVVKPQPVEHPAFAGGAFIQHKRLGEIGIGALVPEVMPYGGIGDRLWVRESWQGPLVDGDTFERSGGSMLAFQKPEYCRYAADGGPRPEYLDADDRPRQGWKPGIHMFRWASRITLEITGVRVERLQDISEADAKAEGCDCLTWDGEPGPADLFDWPLKTVNRPWANGYALLWESINGDGTWAANPWVWVIEFRRLP